MPEPFGVVHVFIPGEPSEDGLTKHADQRVPAVLARACVGKPIARRFAQSQCVIEFAIRKQTCIRGNDGTPKVNHHAPFEIRPQDAVFRFTRRVHQFDRVSSA